MSIRSAIEMIDWEKNLRIAQSNYPGGEKPPNFYVNLQDLKMILLEYYKEEGPKEVKLTEYEKNYIYNLISGLKACHHNEEIFLENLKSKLRR
jgi:hypothetical protein